MLGLGVWLRVTIGVVFRVGVRVRPNARVVLRVGLFIRIDIAARAGATAIK